MIFETTHYYLSFLFSHASLSPQHGKIKKMKYNKCQIIHICLFFYTDYNESQLLPCPLNATKQKFTLHFFVTAQNLMQKFRVRQKG